MKSKFTYWSLFLPIPVGTELANNVLMEQLRAICLMILGVNILTLGAPLIVAAYGYLTGHLSPHCRKRDWLLYARHFLSHNNWDGVGCSYVRNRTSIVDFTIRIYIIDACTSWLATVNGRVPPQARTRILPSSNTSNTTSLKSKSLFSPTVKSSAMIRHTNPVGGV